MACVVCSAGIALRGDDAGSPVAPTPALGCLWSVPDLPPEVSDEKS